MKDFEFSSLAKVNQQAALCYAAIRDRPEYFQVTEILPFEPDGTGGHVWLKIRKTGVNTEWLARQLARFAKVRPVAIGYAGLKDRHAVTTQWFSVNLEGRTEPDWGGFDTPQYQIITQTRHGKKLKRGVLAGNRFVLQLTQLTGPQTIWKRALQRVKEQGVPNYFGPQRFGYQGANLQRVADWFEAGQVPRQRHQKSMYLSAARGWLFNQVLSARVSQQNWNQGLAGDMMLLSGTRASTFLIESCDTDIQSRLDSMDIHPTGPLWGQGECTTRLDSAQLEAKALSGWTLWRQGLEQAGLKQARRSLRLYPNDFEWAFGRHQLRVSFFLPAGCYATSILRELAIISDEAQRN